MSEALYKVVRKTQYLEADGYHPPGETIVATAQLTIIARQAPYFSLTGEIRRYGHVDCCGCIHDEILRHWPDLEIIRRLHLAYSNTGEPMHGYANGWYWLAGALDGLGDRYHGDSDKHQRRTPEECIKILADHLRMDVAGARFIVETIGKYHEGNSLHVARYIWNQMYTEMLPRFREEAKAGVDFLKRHASAE
jgi:hypothetical protein